MIDFNSDFGRIVRRRLDEDYFIWFTTVASDLSPQPRPVWFVWDGDSLILFSEPGAHKVRHVRQHQQASVHFNTADPKGEQEVVVLLGTAVIDAAVPPAHQVSAYMSKYDTGIADLGLTGEEFSRKYSVAIRFHPASVRGW